MKPETQELIDRANAALLNLSDEYGWTEDIRILGMVTTLLDQYVHLGDEAAEVMKGASAEITRLREQVSLSRQGAALLALEKEQARNKVLLESLQAIVGATTQGFLSTATLIARTTITENENV